jgi:Domain of unknown function (DUF2017)
VPITNPFRMNADGTVKVVLAKWKRDLLADLPAQLKELMATDDPSLRRLFPMAYHDDEEREAEYQRYMREELLASRLAATERTIALAQATQITMQDLEAWVNVLNSLRLVLGTQLDVSEDDFFDGDLDDARLPRLQLYHWLGSLVDYGVRTLSKGLPD